MKTKLNNKGFTLIEIIFSVAFLCVVSVIVLRLFVASYHIENETDLKDMATLHMVNQIEYYKSLESMEALEVIIFYDEYWQKTDHNDAFYQVVISVSKSDLYSRGLYHINGKVKDKSSQEEIVSVKTMHYYNHKE